MLQQVTAVAECPHAVYSAAHPCLLRLFYNNAQLENRETGNNFHAINI